MECLVSMCLTVSWNKLSPRIERLQKRRMSIWKERKPRGLMPRSISFFVFQFLPIDCIFRTTRLTIREPSNMSQTYKWSPFQLRRVKFLNFFLKNQMLAVRNNKWLTASFMLLKITVSFCGWWINLCFHGFSISVWKRSEQHLLHSDIHYFICIATFKLLPFYTF